MIENLKKLKIKLIIENKSEKNADWKAEGTHEANLIKTTFNEKDYMIKDINKSKKI